VHVRTPQNTVRAHVYASRVPRSKYQGFKQSIFQRAIANDFLKIHYGKAKDTKTKDNREM